MKLILSLISGFITFLGGVFFVVIILPLGLMGASSEKMVNVSFVFLIAWVLVASAMVTNGTLMTSTYVADKTTLSGITSALIAAAGCLIVGAILNGVGWIAATIIGNQ